jgi:uncharacterized protein YbjQ (UPF0145 family)
MHQLIPVTTTFTLEGYAIREYKGIGAYTEMCEQTREAAFNQMVEHAVLQGANAIVGARYDGSDVTTGSGGATEVLCYGTAVVVEKLESAPAQPPRPDYLPA